MIVNHGLLGIAGVHGTISLNEWLIHWLLLVLKQN